jgi:hypothetical protein
MKKYSVFFQLLFSKYGIEKREEINSIHEIPAGLNAFFDEVLRKKNKNIFIKRAMFWLRRSSPGDHFFTMRRIFR